MIAQMDAERDWELLVDAVRWIIGFGLCEQKGSPGSLQNDYKTGLVRWERPLSSEAEGPMRTVGRLTSNDAFVGPVNREPANFVS